MRILHMAAHLGGGAGKAIAGMALSAGKSSGHEHRILLLQKPEKVNYVEKCRRQGIPVLVADEGREWEDWARRADVVVVSWWHHPVMAEFLANFPDIPCRMALWSHLNGCHYPFLPYGFVTAMDCLLATSAYTWDNPYWTESQKERARANGALVYGTGDFDPEESAHKTAYDQISGRFTIGYAGTLGYAKLHPEFLDWCAEAAGRLPSCRFVMLGDPDEPLLRDVRARGMEDLFEFPGYVPEVNKALSGFDVFGYLISPVTYATTENAVLEAMACGLPVVMPELGVGTYLMEDGVSGLLAKDAKHYGALMYQLYREPAFRARVGMSGRDSVIRNYRRGENARAFDRVCERLTDKPKRIHAFGEVFGETPWEWFAACLAPEERDAFERDAVNPNPAAAAYMTEGKSSPPHFARLYPGDKKLRRFLDWKIAGKGTAV
jgi:glycosyltransferase involved in cell wall biosynthesis